MYGFELVVGDGHANERVHLHRFMKVCFPVRQLGAQDSLAFWRAIDDLASAVVAQDGARILRRSNSTFLMARQIDMAILVVRGRFWMSLWPWKGAAR
jgi:hypothetical protein